MLPPVVVIFSFGSGSAMLCILLFQAAAQGSSLGSPSRATALGTPFSVFCRSSSSPGVGLGALGGAPFVVTQPGQLRCRFASVLLRLSAVLRPPSSAVCGGRLVGLPQLLPPLVFHRLRAWTSGRGLHCAPCRHQTRLRGPNKILLVLSDMFLWKTPTPM